MRKNKFIWILIAVIIILLGFVFFQNMILEKKFENWARLTNNLNVERDFEIYNLLNQNNIKKIKENLDLNFMFHLTAIETDGIQNILDMKSIDRVCKKYNTIQVEFKTEYEKKYPSCIKDLELFCKKK